MGTITNRDGTYHHPPSVSRAFFFIETFKL